MTGWSKQVSEYTDSHEEYPMFDEFVKFVEKEARRACDPVFSLGALKTPTNAKVGASSQLKHKIYHATAHKADSDNTEELSGFACPKCKLNNHAFAECGIVMRLPFKERIELIKSLDLCFSCCKGGHMSKECNESKLCSKCSSTDHPTVLHSKRWEDANLDVKGKNTQTTQHFVTNCTVGKYKHPVQLTSMIVPVYLHVGENNERILTYALIDSQSDTSFIEEGLAKYLLHGSKTQLRISTMTSLNEVVDTTKFKNVKIQGMHSEKQVTIPTIYSKAEIPVERSHIPTSKTAQNWPHLNCLSSSIPPLQNCDVGILIGYNCSDASIPRQVISGKDSEPYGIKTDLGWSIVGGSHCISDTPSMNSINVTHRINTKEIIQNDDVLKRLEGEFPDLKSDTMMSQEDLQFNKIMKNGISFKDGHYSLPLPFKKQPNLPNNLAQAVKRYLALQQKFSKNSKYEKMYNDFMEDIIQKGEAEIVERKSGNPGEVWYVPHHGVVSPKNKEKLRVVFDCSSTFKGKSLNAELLQGPDLNNSLIGLLTRFRKGSVAVMCDIRKMFHQFRVSSEDRNYLRFLWHDKGRMTDFRMTVHLFGAKSSPSCANYGLKQLAQDYKHLYPKASRFVERNFYVDDGLISLESAEEVINLVQETKALCSNANIELHKFVSNKKQVIEVVSEDMTYAQTENTTLIDLQPEAQALGVQWNTYLDCFTIGASKNELSTPRTRREALSLVASLFDPLGFISPFILKGKLLLQELCKENTAWDNLIPEKRQCEWEAWVFELQKLSVISIPRCYHSLSFGKLSSAVLNIFCDASNVAYGACAYLMLTDTSGQSCSSLVMSKSRVAPLKPMTIPRLELMAAVTGIRLARFLRKELDYDDLKTVLWSDSKSVLGYINNDSRRFHVFVCNRVEEIRSFSDPSQWNYIASEFNPADVISRGSSVAQLETSAWFTGPTIASLSEQMKSTQSFFVSPHDVELRLKAGTLASITSEDNSILRRLGKLSTWKSVVGAVSLLHTHIRKVKKSNEVDLVTKRNTATKYILKLIQHNDLYKEIEQLHKKQPVSRTSKLYKLDPFLDNDGLLRLGGRLNFSRYTYNVKHPYILPKSNPITKLIAYHYHQETAHQGRNTTINKIRSEGLHIIQGTTLISSIINKCVICRKLRGTVATQKMAPLPEIRCEEVPPFTHVGFDCFGPFYVKERRKELKKYGVLFTCLNSRAIHLEMLDDMTSDSFINSLRCLVALRGPISTLKSDRGSNFVGASNELKRCLTELDYPKVALFLSKSQCVFSFNTPSSSHMGGSWERMIRTTRQIINGILVQSPGRLDTSSLRTLLYEVMGIVNSRPISTLTANEINQPEALTPNHLLTMKVAQPLPPPGEFTNADIYSRKRWRRVQALAEQFWSRWRHEYLSTLNPRQKWNTQQRNMKVGDVVFVMDDNIIRNQWKLGRIVTVKLSEDGKVRTVSVKLSSRVILERPVHKLILLVGEE